MNITKAKRQTFNAMMRAAYLGTGISSLLRRIIRLYLNLENFRYSLGSIEISFLRKLSCPNEYLFKTVNFSLMIIFSFLRRDPSAARYSKHVQHDAKDTQR